MSFVSRSLVAAAAVLACSGASAQVAVAGNATTPVDLGNFAAGSYLLAASGTVDLCGAGGTFLMKPDGTPASPVTCSGSTYNMFNPNGSFTADDKWGPGGNEAKIGALIGTFNASASSAPVLSNMASADWFLVGYSTTVTLASAGHIYALVNDTYFPNNTGSYLVTVTAVPEPETYAMLLAGLAVVGFVARRRKL